MEATKTCTKCGEVKDVGEFSFRKDKDQDGVVITRVNRQCKACLSAKQREWLQKRPDVKERTLKRMKEQYDADPEKFRQKSRDWRSKMTDNERREYYKKCYRSRDRFTIALETAHRNARREGYAACTATIEEIQSAFTGFCHNPECNVPEAECNMKLRMDHDHTTGSFRGWLCHRCNAVLGFVDDSEAKLIALARYLANDSARQQTQKVS